MNTKQPGLPFASAAEWEASHCSMEMLGTVLPSLWLGPAYHRKLRVWAVACVRRCWGRLRYSYDSFFGTVPDRVAAIVDLLDVNPDEAGRRREELHSEWECWNEELLKEKGRSPFYGQDEATIRIVGAILSFGAENPLFHPQALAALYDSQGSTQREVAAEADLLRCVLGNPWRQPRIDPAWLLWNGGVVLVLTKGICADGSFGELPVLADALEESGCTDEYLLGHLRRPLHCRGCHALDAILGRHPAIPVPGDAMQILPS